MKYAFRVSAKYIVGGSVDFNETAFSEITNVTTFDDTTDQNSQQTICYSMEERLSTVTNGDLWGVDAPTLGTTSKYPPECDPTKTGVNFVSMPTGTHCHNFWCNSNNNGLNNNDGMVCLARNDTDPLRSWPPNITADETYDGSSDHLNDNYLYQNNFYHY